MAHGLQHSLPMKTNRKENQERKVRMAAVSAACADEIARFNSALRNGAVAVLETSGFGRLFVLGCSEDFVLTTSVTGHSDWITNSRAYIANDGRWTSLLEQTGVARNPLFA